MEHIFKYLSREEENALIEKGGLQIFVPEAPIVQEGAIHNGIYIIKSGGVRVEKDSSGFSLELSLLGSGQIFGEMSFLDGIAASASVVAGKDGAEVYVIDGPYVESLLETEPGFFGRFYKSLADILCQRVRETNVLVANEHWEPI